MKESKKIKQYIENNKLNIEKVMNDFTPYIYTIISNKSSKLRDEDIEEIISDVYVAIWKNRKNLDTNKEMSAYIGGITNNIFCKKLRNLKDEIDIEDYENNLYDTENIEVKIENTEKSNLIINEINSMKYEDKTIFVSYYYHSKSIREIAKEINISEEKVKSRLFRIRRKLKKVLERRGYSYG